MSRKTIYTVLLSLLLLKQLFSLSFADLEKKDGVIEFYSIKMYNSSMGYSKTEYKATQYKGRKAVKIETEASSELLKGGKRLSFTLSTASVFDEKLNLLFFTYSNKSRDFSFSCENEKETLVFYNSRGEITGRYPYNSRIPFSDFLTSSIPDDLEPGESVTLDFYSIDTEDKALVIDKRTITFDGSGTYDIDGKTYNTKKYRVQVESSNHDFLYEFWIDQEKKVIRELHNKTMSFVYSPAKTAPSYEAFNIDNYDRIFAPQKVITSSRMSTMTVAITGSHSWPDNFFPDSPVQKILHRTDKKVTLKLSRSHNTIPANLTGLTIPSEIAPYTRSSTIIQSDHQAIREKAREIVDSEKRIRFQVIKLLNWIKTHIKYTDSSAELNSTQILTLKTGDCSEYSNLLVAFLRSLGIPARQVSGLKYIGWGIFGLHSWAQIYTGSWITVDPVEGSFPGPYLIEIKKDALFDTRGSSIEIISYTSVTKTFRPGKK